MAMLLPRRKDSDKPPIAGYVDPKIPNPNGPNDISIIIYGYTPSEVLSILAIVIFSLSLLCHIYQIYRYRTWYFITYSIGTLMEVVGYVFRLRSHKNPYNLINFVVQYFFIVVAPVFFSAAIYAVISVGIRRIGRQYAPRFFPPKTILWVFIVSDVVATVVQIAGAASIGTAESNRKDPTTANNILLAGLAFQVASFLLFEVILGMVLWRVWKGGSRSNVRAVRPFAIALVVASLLVYLRTIFRLAETAEGLMKFLSTHEVFFGVLEFAPVAYASLIFNMYHPGEWLSRYKPEADNLEESEMISH